jgi:hypothetical protein
MCESIGGGRINFIEKGRGEFEQRLLGGRRKFSDTGGEYTEQHAKERFVVHSIRREEAESEGRELQQMK